MTMKRLVLVLCLVLSAVPARAQITATIRATDASTGADVQRVGDDANDSLRVTIASPTTMPVSGTVAVTQSGSWLVQGLAAHDAAYSGDPIPNGCYASASAPTNVSADGDMVRMWCLRNGALSVNLTNTSIAATQSGTWTVLPGNTANTTAWLVTGTGGTFPATQSGTWSTRTQDGSGNAITSATRGSERALTVQVVDASGTQVTSFGGAGSNAAASATGSAVPSSASYTGLNVSGTHRGWTGLSLGSQFAGTVAIVDGSGNQVTSFGGSGGTASNFTSTVPATGTAVGFSDGTNMQAGRVFDGDSGAGTQYVVGVGLRKIASGGTVEAGTSSDPLRTDPTGTTAQPATQSGTWNITNVSGTVSLPTGAATSAAQTTGNSSLSSIDGKLPALVSGRVPIDGSGVTQPVSGTFWQATQPVSISGNQAVNLAQVAGASTATGNGTAAGSIRVALPTDGTGVVGLNAGTNLVGSVGRKNTFDSAVTMTTTNFTSLGSGSGWGGGAITTSGCSDIRFRVLTKGSSASNTLYVDFFLATAIAGETTFDDAASASEGAFTAANRKNSRQVGTVLMNGTSAVQGSFSALDTFPTLPAEIVPIAINSSGAALSSTGADHVIKYECVR